MKERIFAIPRAIDDARVKLGISRKELAEKLGASTETLYRLLRGGTTSWATARKVAGLLNVPLKRLFRIEIAAVVSEEPTRVAG